MPCWHWWGGHCTVDGTARTETHVVTVLTAASHVAPYVPVNTLSTPCKHCPRLTPVWHPQAGAAAAATAAAKALGADASSTTAPALAGLAGLQACRSLLAGSRDQEAAAAGGGSSSSLLAQHTQQLLVGHATASVAAASAPAALLDGLAALRDALAAQQQQQQQGSDEHLLLAVGHKVAGDVAVAQVRWRASSGSSRQHLPWCAVGMRLTLVLPSPPM